MDALSSYWISLIISSISFVCGINILKGDITRHTIFHVKRVSSLISIVLCLCFGLFVGFIFINCSPLLVLFVITTSLIISFFFIYLVTKLCPKSKAISLLFYFFTSFVVFLIIQDRFAVWYAIIWSFVYGLYSRNSPFGAPHVRFLVLARLIENVNYHSLDRQSESFVSELYSDFLRNKNKSILQDFSYAGYLFGESDIVSLLASLKQFDVRDYGIFPNQEKDYTLEIQRTIDVVGREGGGILYFPNGKYNIGSQGVFIQINFNNIVIKGESSKTVFVSHCPTLIGDRNPWLSPFVFTTGERIQESNIFFGVQFKKKKDIITRSASLTDPGSDGAILEPEYITEVIRDAKRGDNILYLKDTRPLQKYKYIILVLYNSDGSDNLLKSILDVDRFREEWQTALRAKEEVAPSFQWLIEIDKIVDINIVRIKQPLRLDIETRYTPEVYGVEMLEKIGFMSFTLRSRWNGIFRHHGFPLYFSKKEAQIMDYGWNGINIKRVAHGFVKNITIENFTNPLYVQDSRNVTIENILIKGSSGHQGIKLYGHASDNLFSNIRFETDFADMMGGEGNCYGNVFTKILYCNTVNTYVDFDFHGFSEGPFSPPAFNLFELVYGFRGIKGGGAIYNQPACAKHNVWWNVFAEGSNGTPDIFVNLAYSKKSNLGVHVSSLRHAFVTAIQNRKFDKRTLVNAYKKNVQYLKSIPLERRKHFMLFKSSILSGYKSYYDLRVDDPDNIYIIKENINGFGFSFPLSLYSAQKESRLKDS